MRLDREYHSLSIKVGKLKREVKELTKVKNTLKGTRSLINLILRKTEPLPE